MQKKISVLQNKNTLRIGALALLMLFQQVGYCDDQSAKSAQEIDAISSNISNFLFGSTIRRVALTLGMGAGLFQAFMSGSIRPLLIYGGLGLAVCYLPKIVEWISKVG